MPPLLPLTELALSDYREHIARYPDTDQAILDYLVQHINALMCSEVEREVSRLFRERFAKGCQDAATLNHILWYIRRGAVSNATFQEIRDRLSRFSNEHGKNFDDRVRQSVGDVGIGRMTVAVEKRNATAHDIPPSITFQELEAAYTVANEVVEAVRVTLEN